MNNDKSRNSLLQRLRIPDAHFWSIIAELGNISEVERRRILRPHAEAGFDWQNENDIIDARKRLDDALDVLTLLEIGYELGIATPSEIVQVVGEEAPILDDLKKLFESQAMWLYVSAYSYFAIRFLAGRLAPPFWFNPTSKKQPIRDKNERIFPLECPPDLRLLDENQFEVFLDLPQDSDIKTALDFLDDYGPIESGEGMVSGALSGQSKGVQSKQEPSEPEQLELWLQGLRPETDEPTAQRFRSITKGILDWASQRAGFYSALSVQTEQPDAAAARFALADVYWIARLFRADVSPGGKISYSRSNWLYLLRFNELLNSNEKESEQSEKVQELQKTEEVLRSVLDFVCDLIQNAAEITDERELQAFAPEEVPPAPRETVKWRTVFDEESEEITKQRSRRRYQQAQSKPSVSSNDYDKDGYSKGPVGWRERIKTGRQPQNLIGLALSGGGIRSATFALGVLQGLQELDLLRYVDYLSTVSGGGFIGSWLVGNVSRTTHWLGRQTSWDESIAHLRRYSSYLAPKTGILSSDTWTMWCSWMRNAFLIQLTGLAWLLTILLAALTGQELFEATGKLLPTTSGIPISDLSGPIAAMGKIRVSIAGISITTGVLTGLMATMVLWTLLYNLGGRAVTGAVEPYTGKYIHHLAKLPALIGGFLLAGLFWIDAEVVRESGWNSYRSILFQAWHHWIMAILLLLVAFFIVARSTLKTHKRLAWWISPLCILVLYLLLCRLVRVVAARAGTDPHHYMWYVFDSLLVLAAYTLMVIVLIKLFGRNRNESLRAWWTRFGTWLFISGAQTTCAVTGAARPSSGTAVRLLAVLPSWIGGVLLASLFWVDARVLSYKELNSYSSILLHVWIRWIAAILLLLIGFFIIAQKTLDEKHKGFAWWISPLCVLVLYLLLCGIERIFVAWLLAKPDRAEWYVYVLGPPMVLAAYTLTVILFIGFCGRYSNEPLREWWTRFGTWLFIFGAGYMFITTAAVFGPPWMLALFSSSKYIKWPTIAGWAGSVVSGLLAGKSSKTNGIKSDSPALEWVAKAGGLLFIIGTVLGSATLLYVLLFNIGTNCAYLRDYWNVLPEIHWWLKPVALVVALGCGVLFSWFFEINVFGLNQFYRNRLVRCYLGATRWAPGLRNPQPFTKFDEFDDIQLSNLRAGYSDPKTMESEFRGPFPILNCALNLAGSSDLSVHTRHSASFSLTPLRCGADRLRVGYAPTFGTRKAAFADGVMLGQAVSISGAAASPNMGYNTSPLVAFLLTMFNVRLGWWFPNPGRDEWSHPGLQFSLLYLTMELFGVADERDKFINVSDGGHFENLGIYELVRRRCKVIIAVDGECDEQLTFGSLGNVVRLCETDFGAKIDIDVSSIRKQEDNLSLGHCAVGTIKYSNGSIGFLVYLKASVTGDEDIGVAQYRSVHPSFPHETTADQFFTEDQFESYRRLGHHIVLRSLRGTRPGTDPHAMAERLYYVLTPVASTSESFIKHTKALDKIWEHFRHTPTLNGFLNELVLIGTTPNPAGLAVQPTVAELGIGLEILQLMENVFLDLRLDDFWEHPDNRGWAILFMRWARSPRLRAIWTETRRTFGIRFEYFCAARLGLPRDEPIVRV